MRKGDKVYAIDLSTSFTQYVVLGPFVIAEELEEDRVVLIRIPRSTRQAWTSFNIGKIFSRAMLFSKAIEAVDACAEKNGNPTIA